MILTAHQPVYLPWLGLFHKIELADQYCIFDRVQYQTKDFNNRNKIKTNAGLLWLSVPVESKNHFDTLLCDVKTQAGNWRKKHCKSIKLAYQKAPFFDRYYPELETTILKAHPFLADLNDELLRLMLGWFDINCPIHKASDYDFQGKGSDLVLDMCLRLGAKKYIFGGEGENYADKEVFKAAGVQPYFQKYEHPQYNQLHGQFEPFASAIDLLFNHGNQAKSILMQNNIANV